MNATFYTQGKESNLSEVSEKKQEEEIPQP
jgi:hypothetical protein